MTVRSHRHAASGFTLAEMMIVLLVFGLLIGFSVPAFLNILGSYQLKGAAENLTGQLRLSRQKAIGLGHPQLWHIWGSTGSYHVHDLSTGQVFGPWQLPKRTKLLNDSNFIINTDGRASTSADILIQDFRGNRDTVSVQVSGLITIH